MKMWPFDIEIRKDARFQEDMARIMVDNLLKAYKASSEDIVWVMTDVRNRFEKARCDMSPKELVAWLHGFQDGVGNGVIIAKGRDAYMTAIGYRVP